MAALVEDDSEAIPQQAINNEPSLSVAQLEGYQYEEYMSRNNNMGTTLVVQCGSIVVASVAPPIKCCISLAELLNVDQEELPNGDQE
ncbi:unnamed protein product [Ilex paraguariensis]|uniref:Uncharacterized protein n=1 Tax=Ilex paraguariensis TaxID=185542 RepID=A0ABC8T7E8_9AQUA